MFTYIHTVLHVSCLFLVKCACVYVCVCMHTVIETKGKA